MSGIVSETKAVTIYRDQREICHGTRAGRAEYQRRREAIWDRDRGICCLCGLPVALSECTFEHLNGRGMGGGKRDDRESENAVSHYFGNSHRGSVSMVDYMKKPLSERIRACGPLW